MGRARDTSELGVFKTSEQSRLLREGYPGDGGREGGDSHLDFLLSVTGSHGNVLSRE